MTMRAEFVESYLPFGNVKRALWVLLTPVAWALNRAGWCGYQWVNLCVGARRRDLFNPLWHHLHFGDPVPDLPSKVILRGIPYEAQYSGGLVTFRNNDLGETRITFTRDEDALHLWSLSLSGDTPASHVAEAYEWVYAVFGGTFTPKRSTDTVLTRPGSPPRVEIVGEES
jgi:hypothetical protein